MQYLKQGLLNQTVYNRVTAILKLWEKIAENERTLAGLDQERDKIYKAQQQIQGNMGALGQTGKEGAMRVRYVEQLEATEEQLKALAAQEIALKAENEQLQREVETRLKAL
jgi:chromosome segregation ATPase